MNDTEEHQGIVPIEWEDPQPIDIDGTPHHVRWVRSGDAEYLLYCAGDYEGYSASLHYMVRARGGEWSEPAEVPLNLSVYKCFDCVLDEDSGEFVVTFCHWNDTASYLYMSRGDLDRMTAPQMILGLYPGGGALQGTGPWSHSLLVLEDGPLSVYYCWLSGASENANELFLIEENGSSWSEPERIGVGNSPHALLDSDGEVHLFSNLWGYTPERQASVDEWTRVDGEWTVSPVLPGTEGWNTEPCVLEDADGTLYLIYDHNPNRPGTVESLLVQTRRPGEEWSEVHRIVSSGSRFGIAGQCALLEGDVISVVYIAEDGLYSMDGTIER